ncbi:porin family protein [Flavobacterium geliluteum]|uniref:PorT family protein n=1 Tax=Flavobacterium geliluteum TaxID=2816120 RepID=A0A940XI29_9FLAO|nr:porin family protein [Flavobacterium geliluteum]MBP4139598.1 PorT family protein [Flavobacterium geliluteum]
MKKILLAAVLLVATSATLQAQFLRIGVKGGVNFANFSGTEIQTDAITSYHGGLVAELKILDRFAIQPELLYNTQGAEYKSALGDFKNELGYISIPVMAKIYLTDSFSLEAGPQASFLVSEKNDFDVEDSNTFDFAVNAGLGFKITKSLFVQGRYSIGLTEVSKNADAKNSVFSVSAGFLF